MKNRCDEYPQRKFSLSSFCDHPEYLLQNESGKGKILQLLFATCILTMLSLRSEAPVIENKKQEAPVATQSLEVPTNSSRSLSATHLEQLMTERTFPLPTETEMQKEHRRIHCFYSTLNLSSCRHVFFFIFFLLLPISSRNTFSRLVSQCLFLSGAPFFC